MAGNSAFELVSERGWRRGLSNLLNNELAHWWMTRLWWIQCLIWVGVVGFMLAAVIFSEPNFQFFDGVMLYSIFAGLFPAVGVIIIMQGALVGEKQDGTAAWVLSKPASRTAFILSKLAANSLGVLVTMVLVPGIVAYILLSYSQKAALDPLPFLAAWAIIFLNHFFYLTLTLMLGALFSSRGPVIGIALAFLFLQQYLIGLLPLLRYLLPWTLAVPLNNQTDAVVPALLQGQPVYSWIPVAAVLLESILFVLVALRRFQQEEF
jgi:ABC-2 type transport system permease protein